MPRFPFNADTYNAYASPAEDFNKPFSAKAGPIKPVRAAILRAGVEAFGGPEALLARVQAAVATGRVHPKAYEWLRLTIVDIGLGRKL